MRGSALAALALSTGSKVSSTFSHRGYNACANLLRRTLPVRDISSGSIRMRPSSFPMATVTGASC